MRQLKESDEERRKGKRKGKKGVGREKDETDTNGVC